MVCKGINKKAALCGFFAGAVNGLLGSGGGIVLVPLFMSWLKLPAKKAFATSVSVTVVFSILTVLVCIFTNDMPPVKQALGYTAGGFLGGILAGRLLKTMPAVALRRIFGALLILGGIKTLL